MNRQEEFKYIKEGAEKREKQYRDALRPYIKNKLEWEAAALHHEADEISCRCGFVASSPVYENAVKGLKRHINRAIDKYIEERIEWAIDVAVFGDA